MFYVILYYEIYAMPLPPSLPPDLSPFRPLFFSPIHISRYTRAPRYKFALLSNYLAQIWNIHEIKLEKNILERYTKTFNTKVTPVVFDIFMGKRNF